MSETRDRSRTIFGNRIGEATCRKAVKQKNAFLKKFGDDRSKGFCLSSEEIPELAALGIRNLKVEPRGTHAAGSSSSACQPITTRAGMPSCVAMSAIATAYCSSSPII